MKKIANPTADASQEAGLRRYLSLGLGTAVLAGAVTTADASVVYTNYNSILLNDTNTADTTATIYGYDVNSDGSQDFRFLVRNQASDATRNYAIVVAGANGSQIKPINVVGVTSSGFVYPSRLAANALIGAAGPFVTLSLTASGSFLQGGTFAFGNGFTNSKWKTAGSNSGYFGFSFTAADGLHYGFAQMSVAPQGSGTNSRAITLSGIAYESTPNTAITTFAAPVPEPSSIALVALGGLGIAAYRRRRAGAKAAA